MFNVTGYTIVYAVFAEKNMDIKNESFRTPQNNANN
jgi:hypothetical protein